MKKTLLSFCLFAILSALVVLEAAGRPFVYTTVIEYVGVRTVPATTESTCVVPGLAFQMGNGMIITVTDPVLRSHLKSFHGKKVTLVIEEAN